MTMNKAMEDPRQRSLGNPFPGALQNVVASASAETVMKAGMELCESLSASLQDLLLSPPAPCDVDSGETPDAKSDADNGRDVPQREATTDIYHQFLNSPGESFFDGQHRPRHHHQQMGQAEAKLTEWTRQAMESVGVGTATNALKFWNVHGNEHEEAILDARYLVWLAKEILLLDVDGTSAAESKGALRILEQWQHAIVQLIDRASISSGANEEEVHAPDVDARVMWQLLLQNAQLSPKVLNQHFSKRFPQHRTNLYSNTRDKCNVTFSEQLIMHYFQWPSFLRSAVLPQSNDKESNKRRKRNDATPLKISNHSLLNDEQSSNAWWSLLGYMLTHAFLSLDSPSYFSNNNNAPNATITIHQRIQFLQSNFATTLPVMMGISFFDFKTRNSLLSGMTACVLDALGEAVIWGTWVLEQYKQQEEVTRQQERLEIGVEGNVGGDGMCSILGAEVGQIVDLLLMKG